MLKSSPHTILSLTDFLTFLNHSCRPGHCYVWISQVQCNDKTESFLIFANLINVVSPFLVTSVFSSASKKLKTTNYTTIVKYLSNDVSNINIETRQQYAFIILSK